MKKIALILAIIAGGFLPFSSVDYSKAYRQKYPGFLTNIVSFNHLKAQEREISGWNELGSISVTDNDLWAVVFGGDKNDVPENAQKTDDGGLIITGYSYSFFYPFALWIIKFFPNGEIDWQKIYTEGIEGEGSKGDAIQQTADGGYIVAGSIYSHENDSVDMWIFKLDSKGEIEWQKKYGGEKIDSKQSDIAMAILQTLDGGYIVAGYTLSFGKGSADFWVLKLFPDGSIDWQETFGEENWDEADAVIQTMDGGYIVCGRNQSEAQNLASQDIWIIKLSSRGNIEWQKKYGADGEDTPSYSILQTIDGGYIISGGLSSDGWVSKLYPDGEIEWQKAIGGTKYDAFWSSQHTQDGGYVFAGATESFGGGLRRNIWVVKLSSQGKIKWQRTYGMDDSEDYVRSIQEASDGGLLVVGYNWLTYYKDGIASKLSPQGEIPGCELMQSSEAVAIDTTIVPVDTEVKPRKTDVTAINTKALAYDTDAQINVICSTSIRMPKAPRNLKAKAISWSKIKLRWKDKSKDEDGFFIERRSDTNGTWKMIKKLRCNAKKYKDKGLEPDKLYYYRIRAFNSNGYSAYSNVAEARTNKQ